MNDHPRLPWLMYALSATVSFLSDHWGLVAATLFGAVGATCHVIQTRIKWKEYEDAKRERERILALVPLSKALRGN